MDRLLSLSQAARMVGVPRRLLQQHIQEGRIAAFEGYIRMSELRKAYPQADSDRSAMVEKVQRIREAALFKSNPEARPDAERMATELQRARVEMARLEDELGSYRLLAAETGKSFSFSFKRSATSRARSISSPVNSPDAFLKPKGGRSPLTPTVISPFAFNASSPAAGAFSIDKEKKAVARLAVISVDLNVIRCAQFS